jgi:Amt family ammonium transporter
MKHSKTFINHLGLAALFVALATVLSVPALAEEAAQAPAGPLTKLAADLRDLRVAADTAWTLITAFLVFFMNLGFGLVESGLQRQKNCVNILSKNFVVFAAATLSFYVLGWGLMFGDGSGFLGLKGLWCLAGADNSPATLKDYHGVYGSINWTGVPLWAKFFFQLVFAGTAATIVSGAVGERIKFQSFILFTLILIGIFYPITGHWIWGGGWLSGSNFRDFAGSTVVHSVGGWAALAGAIILGPRLGKFGKDGKINPIPGHSMPLVFTGTLVLWFGWFGFNPGSTMSIGNGYAIAHIVNTTNLAAAVASITAMLTAWILLGKPDFSMICNGCLAGLVAITAPCAFVSIPSSLLIGAVAGILVVFAVIFFDKIKVDDPVGAISVHMVNGIWGTLALGLFYDDKIAADVAGAATGLSRAAQFVAQLKGALAVGAFTFIGTAIVWLILKYTVGIRVTEEEEIGGLDLGEHGQQAYPDFVVTQPAGIHGLSSPGAMGMQPSTVSLGIPKSIPTAN